MTKDEESFFNQLYTDTYVMLKRYICRHIGSEYAEDILQETYYQAFLQLHKLQYHENPRGWMMLTCKNFVLKQRGRCGFRAEHFIQADAEQVLENIAVNDYYDFGFAEELEKILTDEEYYLLVMKYIEGYSIEELADILNITGGACKMRLKRARKKVKNKWKFFVTFILLRGLYITGGIIS